MAFLGVDLPPAPPQAGLVFSALFVLSLSLTGLFYAVALRARLLPQIRERDVHAVRKPRVGGAAMWLAAVLGLLWIATDPAQKDLLSFGAARALGIDRTLWGVLAGSFVLLAFGFIDDIRGLRWHWQLSGQVLAAVCLWVAGVGLTYVRLPFDYRLPLDRWAVALPGFLGGETVYLAAGLFIVAWVVTMVNVMNFFDGLDGLAGSVGMTAAGVLFLLSLRLQLYGAATLALVTAAVAAGFLVWNWYPSKIFMGTVGSQQLGFLLGTAAIVSGGKMATAVLVLGIPVLDAFIVILRRLKAGASPFQADMRHLHHRLLKIGLPVPWVVVLINAVSVAFGVLALRTQVSTEKGVLALLLILCMTLFILLTYLLERRAARRVD